MFLWLTLIIPVSASDTMRVEEDYSASSLIVPVARFAPAPVLAIDPLESEQAPAVTDLGASREAPVLSGRVSSESREVTLSSIPRAGYVNVVTAALDRRASTSDRQANPTPFAGALFVDMVTAALRGPESAMPGAGVRVPAAGARFVAMISAALNRQTPPGAREVNRPASARAGFVDVFVAALRLAWESPAPLTADAARLAAPSRYARGGISFDSGEPLRLTYPLWPGSDERVTFDDLAVLLPDDAGESYRQFIAERDQQLFAYPEMVANTFVLSMHDGTISASGRELEAEPLRRLIEGPLHSPHTLETIQQNLAELIGTHLEFEQQGRVARFSVVQARRMSANDVATYLYRPMELSLYMDPMASPETSFLVLFCSGRQPDEPQRPFPGRFVLVLQESGTTAIAAQHGQPEVAE